MKRILKILSVVVIAFVPMVVGTSAYAQATCQIGYTGPDSNNMCTSTTTYDCTVTNTNEVTIVNTNTQEAVSGTVTTSGNTTGGNSTSGTVSNSNGTVFNVTITNPTVDTDPQTCVATLTVPATNPPTPVQPPAQPQPSGGGGAAELPNTSGDDSGTIFATVLAILGVGALGTAVAALAYRRLKA